MNILAIETSFDDTSVAILINEQVVSMKTHSQIEKHNKFGGVIPELASRLHSENIFSIIHATLADANMKLEAIDAVAVTTGPGLVNTLQVGLVVAKTLGMSLQIPVYGINHMDGHVYSPFIDKKVKKIPKNAIVLLVSGGHTILAKKLDNKIQIVGETLDDAVGEAYDKVSKVLGFGFPGGPAIDKIFRESDVEPAKVPVPKVNSYNFSFSGIKSHVNKVKNSENRIAIAKGFQLSAVKHLMDKVILLQNKSKIDEIIVGGGVSANSYFRKELSKLDAHIHLPRSVYTIDNAAMIGYVAHLMIKKRIIKPLKLSADANPKRKVGK